MAESIPLLSPPDFSDGSYMIVLCSRERRSNIRTEPSAPQETNTSTLLAQKLPCNQHKANSEE